MKSQEAKELGQLAGQQLRQVTGVVLGLTPVLVRYNSGLRISDNGAALGALLADLVAGWPVPLTRIAHRYSQPCPVAR
ncbi:hypothetical protein [Nostocoides veronense]|uniref:Uncharacterized protein n=1 Tax=Nostocoides veronense TaxID=330836 RepID=A0ABP4YBZ8_9MICO